MIARPLEEIENVRIVGGRAARTAALERRKRTERLRYRTFARTVALVAIGTVAVVAYLTLMANVTRLNYEMDRATLTTARLQATASELDDKLARMRSRDRLAAIAAKLHMHAPATLLSVNVPAPRTTPAPRVGFAFLLHAR